MKSKETSDMKEAILKQGENRRFIPQSDLDYNFELVSPDWGKDNINKEFNKRLLKIKKFEKDKDGKIIITDYSNLWNELNFYTKDLRLSNLDNTGFTTCQHYLNLAKDCLSCEFIEAFSICISRVASIIELSQSRSGFLV